MAVYLERRNAAQNLARFYAIDVTKDLFGQWAVIREWGRIGQDGTVRPLWFNTETAASEAASALRDKKMRKGYGCSTLPRDVAD